MATAGFSDSDRFGGLPQGEIESWLENLRSQIAIVRARIEAYQTDMAKLQEQEGLLMELLATTSGSN